MIDIAVETDDPEAFSAFAQINGVQALVETERKGLDGATLFTTIVTLTPPVIAAVVAVIRAQINARRYVRVTCKGVVVQGISEKTLLKLLQDESS